MTVAYTGGILARSERYMRSHWDHAKGFIDDAGLEASAKQEESDQVASQQSAGLDLLSPALVRWEDLFRPLTWSGAGCASGQLTRYFETNTFFRQPNLSGPIAPADPRTWFRSFQIPSGSPWVLTLPSPWDFAVRARDDTSSTTAERAIACAQALQPIVSAARKTGAAVVRFHDPSILYGRTAGRDITAFTEGLATAAKGNTDICTLHLTNGDPFAHPEVLESNPLRGLSIEDPGVAPGRINLPNATRLSAAVLRGEESLVESPQELARAAASLAQSLGVDLWGITNGWDLDHVPNAIAVRKVQALAKARAHVTEVLV